jgi:Spy/CpxP family protein refolding chaperone
MTQFKKVLFGLFAVSVLAAIFPVPCSANAENPGLDGASPKWHSGQRIQEIYKQLNLTDEQKKQLEANKQQHRAKMEMARQEIRKDREALKEELMKPRLDMPKITALHNQIKAVQSRVEDDKLSSILNVRAILTPEQFSEFVGLMHKHKQGHEKQSAE